jgi:dihydroflavonol-4-reductase
MGSILITGGCGFLGQYLTQDLLKEFPKKKIRILDLKANPASLFDFSKNKNVKISLNKDITDYFSIKDEFKDIDTVIHLAGIVSFHLKDKNLLGRVNIFGTMNVLEAARRNKVKQVIHISSVAALGYEDNKNELVDETFNFDWRIARKKKKYYMLTKHIADKKVEQYRRNGLKCMTLYPGLLFGPGDVTNSAKLITAIKNKKIPVNMPGGTNIIDVRDVSKGIIAAMKKGKRNGDYLLSGHNLTFKQINRTMARLSGVEPPKKTLPKFLNTILFKLLLFIEARSKKKIELPADNLDSAFKFRYFSNARAKKELDWEPKIRFEQTIKDTIKWMGKNG